MTSMTELSLKLLVDTKANMVIFAEAGKEFVDFLFAILSLPVGTIMKIVKDPSVLGCMGNVYESLQRLDTSYFQAGHNKDTVFKYHAPTNATNVSLLLPRPEKHPTSRKLYRCGNNSPFYGEVNQSCHGYVSENNNTACGSCGRLMTKEVKILNAASSNATTSSGASSSTGAGFVKDLVTYMVTDDLSVSPLSMISLIAQLAKFNLQSLGELEAKTVSLGMDEVVELMKASLKSEAALTSVFLRKKSNVTPTSGRFTTRKLS